MAFVRKQCCRKKNVGSSVRTRAKQFPLFHPLSHADTGATDMEGVLTSASGTNCQLEMCRTRITLLPYHPLCRTVGKALEQVKINLSNISLLNGTLLSTLFA